VAGVAHLLFSKQHTLPVPVAHCTTCAFLLFVVAVSPKAQEQQQQGYIALARALVYVLLVLVDTPLRTPPPAGRGAAGALVPPAGWRMAASSEILAGRALVGRPVLFHWPEDGWVRGRVARVSRAAGFSHVVTYGPRSPLEALAVVSLLDAASHGPAGRWVLLLPDR
jgi:hypothetical protein